MELTNIFFPLRNIYIFLYIETRNFFFCNKHENIFFLRSKMAYSLRSRSLAEQLMADDAESDGFDDEASESEQDFAEELSGSESESVTTDSDWEDETLNQRLQASQARRDATDEMPLAQRLLEPRSRDRPSTKIKGKNGYTWDTRVPERNSGMFSACQTVDKYVIYINL